jgi:hypothetical protein
MNLTEMEGRKKKDAVQSPRKSNPCPSVVRIAYSSRNEPAGEEDLAGL